VIQGRDDMITPSALAEQFVMDVRAPSKEYVPIEGGHFACLTNPDGFVDALENHVLPLT
jgi:pimeloyl-ACP methyl ester carboxylesterase